MDKKSLISIVTPTYNEKENIIPFIKKVTAFFISHKLSLEIIIVDDNSPDGTAQLVLAQKQKFPHLSLIQRKNKKGIGSAYFDGFTQAKGERIIAIDADLSQSLDSIPFFLEKLNDGVDMVIASRYIQGSRVTGIPLAKQIGGRVFNYGIKLFLDIPLVDSTHSYRAFTKKAFKKIAKKIVEVGHPAFFIEFSFWAKECGFLLAEVSTEFREREEGYSKLNLKSGLQDAGKLLLRLRKLKK
jgi:dolichol-phosphate mannosyltransferase